MWVQPSLGVLSFIWENGEDTLCFLHPFKDGRKSKRNVCWRGDEPPPMRWPVRQILEEHLLTEGNTVWTSGNRRLRCVSSILLGFLLCLTVRSLQSLASSYMVIRWEKHTFIRFFWHEESAWFHWDIPLLARGWVCGLPYTAEKACLSTTHVEEVTSYTSYCTEICMDVRLWWTDLDAPDTAHLKRVLVNQLILINEFIL